MKQHITVEQITEIAQIFDRIGELYVSEKNKYSYTAENLVKRITIGKMVEILASEVVDFKLLVNWEERGGWIVEILHNQTTKTFKDIEPCDCLLKAVKVVL